MAMKYAEYGQPDFLHASRWMPYLLEIQTPILTFLALSSLSQLRESLDRQCWYIPKMENYHLTSAV